MKNNFYDEIFEKINNIPIEDVFERYGFNLSRVGSNYCLESPFRKGASKTSFTISPQKGIFKDWVIPDCSGNATKFISMLKNINYLQAGMDIALNFEIIDEKTFLAITKNKVSSKQVTFFEKKFNKIEKTISNIAEPEVLDKIYRIFISCCKISDSHKEHLKTVRALTDEEIEENLFFTFPTRGIVRTFLKKIEAEYGNQEILATIPGFFKRVGDTNYSFMSNKGIGIPIFNEQIKDKDLESEENKKNKLQFIVGIQIRRDVVKEGELRYIWFSSSFAIDDPKCKYEEGTSSGSPIDVIYPKEVKYKGVFITEGKFKALQLAKTYNCICLSVQGVSTWKNIESILKRLPNIVGKKDWNIKKIYTAFDADMNSNINVYNQLKKMTDSLKNALNVDIEYLLWDLNLGKGIDDLIIANKKEDLLKIIQTIYKETFDTSYKKLIEKILELNPEFQESSLVTHLSSEEFKEYFDKYFKLESILKE